jgi:hypothetical protein
MRTHTIHAGEVPVNRPHAGHLRGRYLEVPAKPQAAPEVTHEQIERRAYELYLARGDRQGDALSDWLAAERELKSRVPALPPLTKHSDSDLAH